MRSSRLSLFCSVSFFPLLGLWCLFAALYGKTDGAYECSHYLVALAAPAIGSLFTAPIVGPTLSAIKKPCYFHWLVSVTAHGKRPAFIPIYFRANWFCGLSVILNAYVSYLSNNVVPLLDNYKVVLRSLAYRARRDIYGSMAGWSITQPFVVVTLIVIASFVLTNPPRLQNLKRNPSFQLSLIDFMVKRWHFGSSRWLWFGVVLYISEISQSTHSSLSA